MIQGKTVLFRGSETHRQEARPTVSAVVNRSLGRTILVAPACVLIEHVSTTFALVPKSVPLGVTQATEYRTTKVIKTEVGADPQARWIAIPQPEEVRWPRVVRRKAYQKKSAHSSPSLALEPTARATVYHRSSDIRKFVPAFRLRHITLSINGYFPK